AGAPLYADGHTQEGAAFVFLGSAAGIADGSPAGAAAQLESDQAFANLGVTVAGAGDVNGDGYADVIVGAYLYDAGQTDEGAAFVFVGSAAGIADGSPVSAAAQLESDQAIAHLGVTVAGAGDVNGDGYADVIVGVYLYDAGQNDEGAVFVFLGSAAGIADASPASAAAQLESDQDHGLLGVSVAGAGDVNGDGYADAIAGAYLYDAPEANEGVAFVLPFSDECADGVDDDGDELVDFPSDPGCANAADPSERSPALPCDDGRDGDGDGFTDYPDDPGCRDPAAIREDPQCQDGIDNDGQLGIDFDGGASLNGGVALDLPDPQCSTSWKNKEKAPGCGIGFELALALIAPRVLLGRRRPRSAGVRLAPAMPSRSS
ncbi:MAG: integrin alpha, partial [Chloroflexi bacterium]|nr:integrin alpha [Chloroflexota bacterium]